MKRDAFTVEWTEDRGERKRAAFEPRSDGDGWWRVVERHNGCSWVPVGREAVDDVVFESDVEVLTA